MKNNFIDKNSDDERNGGMFNFDFVNDDEN